MKNSEQTKFHSIDSQIWCIHMYVIPLHQLFDRTYQQMKQNEFGAQYNIFYDLKNNL